MYNFCLLCYIIIVYYIICLLYQTRSRDTQCVCVFFVMYIYNGFFIPHSQKRVVTTPPSYFLFSSRREWYIFVTRDRYAIHIKKIRCVLILLFLFYFIFVQMVSVDGIDPRVRSPRSVFLFNIHLFFVLLSHTFHFMGKCVFS